MFKSAIKYWPITLVDLKQVESNHTKTNPNPGREGGEEGDPGERGTGERRRPGEEGPGEGGSVCVWGGESNVV